MILYHQTSVRFLENILEVGLIPFEPDEWKRLVVGFVPEGTPVIWFTDNIREKGSYLHPSKCLVQVDANKLDKTKLVKLLVSGWWVYTKLILPEAIQLVGWKLYRKQIPKFWQACQWGNRRKPEEAVKQATLR